MQCCAAYHKSLRNARRMGALTGFAHGTAAAKDPMAQGTLRLQENIIEWASPSLHHATACLPVNLVCAEADTLLA